MCLVWAPHQVLRPIGWKLREMRRVLEPLAVTWPHSGAKHSAVKLNFLDMRALVGRMEHVKYLSPTGAPPIGIFRWYSHVMERDVVKREGKCSKTPRHRYVMSVRGGGRKTPEIRFMAAEWLSFVNCGFSIWDKRYARITIVCYSDQQCDTGFSIAMLIPTPQIGAWGA